jgi:hypothetical protein
MRSLVDIESKEVYEYLQDEFGEVFECCCIYAPPVGATIEIVEPIETLAAYDSGVIEPGIYGIVSFDNTNTLHGATLHRFYPTQGSFPVDIGRTNGKMVDWRGVRKYVIQPSLPLESVNRQ